MSITERVQLVFLYQKLDVRQFFEIFNVQHDNISVELQIAKVVFCIKKFLEAISELYIRYVLSIM